MDRKECGLGFELIKVAGIRLKGTFSAMFMGAFAMCTPIILMLFMTAILAMLFAQTWIVSIGVCIFIVFIGPLQVGYIKYFNEVLAGNQPRLGVVFSQIRFNANFIRCIYIACLLLLMYLIGGMLWLIPAGFAVSMFSMTFFYYEKNGCTRLTVAMRECATKMIGNRSKMFSYKFIFYVMYLIIIALALLSLVLIYSLSTFNLIISWLVAVCVAIVTVFLYTLVTVYFHSCNQILFEDMESMYERKSASKVKSTTNTASTLKETEVLTTDATDAKTKDDSEDTTKKAKNKAKKTAKKAPEEKPKKGKAKGELQPKAVEKKEPSKA